MTDLLSGWESTKKLIVDQLNPFDSSAEAELNIACYSKFLAQAKGSLDGISHPDVFELLWPSAGVTTAAATATLIAFGKALAAKAIKVATSTNQQSRAHRDVDALGKLFSVDALLVDCFRYGRGLEASSGVVLSDLGLFVARESSELIVLLDGMVVASWGSKLAGKFMNAAKTT